MWVFRKARLFSREKREALAMRAQTVGVGEQINRFSVMCRRDVVELDLTRVPRWYYCRATVCCTDVIALNYCRLCAYI